MYSKVENKNDRRALHFSVVTTKMYWHKAGNKRERTV